VCVCACVYVCVFSMATLYSLGCMYILSLSLNTYIFAMAPLLAGLDGGSAESAGQEVMVHPYPATRRRRTCRGQQRRGRARSVWQAAMHSMHRSEGPTRDRASAVPLGA
jgi:hypothetical protein